MSDKNSNVKNNSGSNVKNNSGSNVKNNSGSKKPKGQGQLGLIVVGFLLMLFFVFRKQLLGTPEKNESVLAGGVDNAADTDDNDDTDDTDDNDDNADNTDTADNDDNADNTDTADNDGSIVYRCPSGGSGPCPSGGSGTTDGIGNYCPSTQQPGPCPSGDEVTDYYFENYCPSTQQPGPCPSGDDVVNVNEYLDLLGYTVDEFNLFEDNLKHLKMAYDNFENNEYLFSPEVNFSYYYDNLKLFIGTYSYITTDIEIINDLDLTDELKIYIDTIISLNSNYNGLIQAQLHLTTFDIGSPCPSGTIDIADNLSFVLAKNAIEHTNICSEDAFSYNSLKSLISAILLTLERSLVEIKGVEARMSSIKELKRLSSDYINALNIAYPDSSNFEDLQTFIVQKITYITEQESYINDSFYDSFYNNNLLLANSIINEFLTIDWVNNLNDEIDYTSITQDENDYLEVSEEDQGALAYNLEQYLQDSNIYIDLSFDFDMMKDYMTLKSKYDLIKSIDDDFDESIFDNLIIENIITAIDTSTIDNISAYHQYSIIHDFNTIYELLVDLPSTSNPFIKNTCSFGFMDASISNNRDDYSNAYSSNSNYNNGIVNKPYYDFVVYSDDDTVEFPAETDSSYKVSYALNDDGNFHKYTINILPYALRDPKAFFANEPIIWNDECPEGTRATTWTQVGNLFNNTSCSSASRDDKVYILMRLGNYLKSIDHRDGALSDYEASVLGQGCRSINQIKGRALSHENKSDHTKPPSYLHGFGMMDYLHLLNTNLDAYPDSARTPSTNIRNNSLYKFWESNPLYRHTSLVDTALADTTSFINFKGDTTWIPCGATLQQWYNRGFICEEIPEMWLKKKLSADNDDEFFDTAYMNKSILACRLPYYSEMETDRPFVGTIAESINSNIPKPLSGETTINKYEDSIEELDYRVWRIPQYSSIYWNKSTWWTDINPDLYRMKDYKTYPDEGKDENGIMQYGMMYDNYCNTESGISMTDLCPDVVSGELPDLISKDAIGYDILKKIEDTLIFVPMINSNPYSLCYNGGSEEHVATYNSYRSEGSPSEAHIESLPHYAQTGNLYCKTNSWPIPRENVLVDTEILPYSGNVGKLKVGTDNYQVRGYINEGDSSSSLEIRGSYGVPKIQWKPNDASSYSTIPFDRYTCGGMQENTNKYDTDIKCDYPNFSVDSKLFNSSESRLSNIWNEMYDTPASENWALPIDENGEYFRP